MPRPIISISPGPDAWRAAMGEPRGTHARDRETLGLPTERAIVMSGHQPVLWHAGILSKLLAASELAKQTGAGVCWIIADMDEVDPTTVRVPHGSGEHTQARTVRTLGGDPPAPGVPTGALPPREAADDDGSIEGFAPLLDAYGFEPTRAMQVGKAVVYLACERFGIDEPVVISCSDLIRTDAWQTLIDAITRDPASCVDAYNRGVEAHPEAHMRPMQSHKGRYELPLWRVRENTARLAVFSDQLASIPADELRPRALAMTALVRSALCELFVHGTGGGVYDRITDDWFSNWSNSPGWQLAPTAVATADAYADFGVDPGQLPDPARAIWRAHHARHDPAMLGDDDAAADKRRLVERIASIKDAGGDPSPVFAELQSLLTATRERHADRLAEFDRLARDASRLAGVRALALDRTWPWPTLSNETLDALHAGIRDRFRSVPSASCPQPPRTDAPSCSR